VSDWWCARTVNVPLAGVLAEAVPATTTVPAVAAATPATPTAISARFMSCSPLDSAATVAADPES
jgi:hypothetical protein